MTDEDHIARFPKIIRDMFTDSGGQTWAIGRIYSVPVLIAGLSIPIFSIAKGQPIDFAALGVYIGATVTAVTVLIRGTSNVDVPPNPPSITLPPGA